jgi:hypothetical protein
MIRSTASQRSGRPARRVPALVAGALLALTIFASPAGAAEDEIKVEPDEQYIEGEAGSVHTVATETVPAELVGKDCDVRVTTVNGGSVHPGNNVITTTGDSVSEMEDVEASAEARVVGVHRVTLGESIQVDLKLGEEGLSSLGFSVGFECTPEDLVPTVEPEQQAPPADPVPATPTYTG